MPRDIRPDVVPAQAAAGNTRVDEVPITGKGIPGAQGCLEAGAVGPCEA